MQISLTDHLIDQLNISRQQAEGGAGLLLQQAQARLSEEDFKRVADAIPAISDIIAKAPRQAHAGWWRATWSRLLGGWGKLAPSRSAFEKLNLDLATIDQFTTQIGDYFRQRSGADLQKLLQSAWK